MESEVIILLGAQHLTEFQPGAPEIALALCEGVERRAGLVVLGSRAALSGFSGRPNNLKNQ